ncbi:MBG domain-containing protein, partial [Amaricoccus macauensis]|uniref:MBG domain-containing protein n=1 Tax=Amaricoccus macauensis TaxID=57001 RepID=UPI003C7AD693
GFTTAAGLTSDVGDYDVAATGLTSGNYEIAYEAGTLTIDPALLTVTTDDASRTYGAANPEFTASYSGFVLGQDAGDLDGTLGFTTAAGLTSDVGNYDVAATGLTSGNYEIAYEAGTLTIDPALLTVTTDDSSRTYGAANPDFTASYSGFVLGQDEGDLDGTLGFTTAAGIASDVGDYDVAANGLTSGNYEIAYEAGTLTIDPAQLTVTADDATRTYGAANPDFTASYSGFVLGQDASDLDGTLGFTTAAGITSDVGDYDVAASGLSSGNYEIAYEAGTLTIDPAQLTVTADDTSRAYGSANPDFTASYSGFVLGQDASDLDGTLGFTTAAGLTSDVGDYDVAANGLTSGNYEIAYEAGTLTIDPALLTVTADDTSRTYGAENPDFTASYSGFVLGQDASDLDGTLGFTTAAGLTSDVGDYGVAANGLTSGNYEIAYEAGTLTIDPAQLIVTADDASRTYGAANPDFTASYSGFVLGQDASDLDGTLGFTTAAGITSDVGDYDVAATGLTSGNYEIAYEAGTLTIDPAQLTVTTDDATRTYGAANPDFTASYSGFVLGQDASDLDGTLGFTTAAGLTSDVGDYDVAAAGLTSGNYEIAYEVGTLTIDPAQLTVTTDDASRTYGAENPDFTASYSGFVLGQDETDLDGTLGFTTAAGRTSDVGDYDVAATGLTSGNYEIAYEVGTLTLDPAQLTVTTDDTSRTYGAENPDFTASYSGFVLGQDETDLDGTLGFETAAGLTSDVGDYDVAAAGLTSGNYEIAYEAGTLTIDPAQLTVTTDDASRTYGAANPEFTASYSGFVLGQDESDLDGTLGFTTAAGLTSDVGDYDVAATGLTSGNYEIAYEAGTLTIDPALLTVTTDDASRTYGAANPEFTASYSGFVLGQDAGDLDGTLGFTTAAGLTSDVGNYDVAATGLTSGNYEIAYEAGTLTIDPA